MCLFVFTPFSRTFDCEDNHFEAIFCLLSLAGINNETLTSTAHSFTASSLHNMSKDDEQ